MKHLLISTYALSRADIQFYKNLEGNHWTSIQAWTHKPKTSSMRWQHIKQIPKPKTSCPTGSHKKRDEEINTISIISIDDK